MTLIWDFRYGLMYRNVFYGVSRENANLGIVIFSTKLYDFQ